VITRILSCQVEHSGDDISFDIGCKMPGYFYGEDQVFASPFMESLEGGPVDAECGRGVALFAEVGEEYF